MIVECPYCSRRYQLDPARLARGNVKLKCSRCQQVFPAPSARKAAAKPAAKAQPKPPPEPPVAAADRNLNLPFDEPSWKDEKLPAGPDLKIPDADDEDRFTLGTEDAEPDLTIPGTDSEPPPATALPETPPAAVPSAAQPAAAPAPPAPPPIPPSRDFAADEDFTDTRDETVDDEDEGRDENDERDEDESVVDEEAPTPRRRTQRRYDDEEYRVRSERGRMTVVLIFLGLTVAVYAGLTRTLVANPEVSDRIIGQIPVVGTLGDERLMRRKVSLTDVTGSYQRIKDGKDVFVISGRAINTARTALHSVQIAGKLIDAEGKELEQKTIYCGNVISTKLLKDLTPREVSVLQTLNPPKRFMIEPGESSTFVIVFMDPPRTATQFTTQVVAAQRQV